MLILDMMMFDNYSGYKLGTVSHRFGELIFGEITSKCINCGADIYDNYSGLCPTCSRLVHAINGKTCIKCGCNLPTEEYYCGNCSRGERHFDKAYSMFVFEGIIPNIIYSVKYGNLTSPCLPLAYYLVYLADKHNMQFDMVCNVPMAETAQKVRGYNQAKLLALYFCDILQISCYCDVLTKVRDTQQQEALTRSQRLVNLDGAYQCDKKVKDMRILLIDDVMTTGATLDNCSIALKRSGAASISCLTVASGRSSIIMEDNNVAI